MEKKGLQEALYFTKDFVSITPDQIEVILYCCKSALFHEGEAWVKKSTGGNFVVPQGSFDRSKISELMGIFILSKVNKFVHIDRHSIYWDDHSTKELMISSRRNFLNYSRS